MIERFFISPSRVLCAMCRTNEAYCLAEVVKGSASLVCGTCPIIAKIDSIKIDDVLKLLEWARKFISLQPEHAWNQSLREIVGNKP